MSRPIEPGVMKLFRWYVAIRLGLLLLVWFDTRGVEPSDPPQFPTVGLVLFGALFVLVLSTGLERRMGRLYLPTAIVLATVAPIADAVANVAGRLDAGLSPNEALVDYWLPFFLLFVPFIITAWQYRYRWVLVFAIGSTLLDMVATGIVLQGHDAQLTTLGSLLAARGILFAFLGFFVTKLIARQREARMELQNHAVALEQVATGRERNRMARELHDTLAHSMTATAVQLEAAEAVWDDDPETARQMVSRALDGTRSGLTEARRAIASLRATPLEERGLAGALAWLGEETSATSGVPVETRVAASVDGMEPHIEQTIYRVAEEALTNSVRHAQGRRVLLELITLDGSVEMTVTDDGTGFDVTAIESDRHGISGMRERAELAGGTLNIESSRGGTRVVLRLPT